MAEKNEPEVNRNILICVDESENARRAVDYVAGLLGGVPGFRVALLHIIPDPEEDYFRTAAEKEDWLSRYRSRLEDLLEDYRGQLVRSGFQEEAVTSRIVLRFCPSMAECILAERDKTAYGTIVVGRQGISRSEEFLFGSISSRIVQHARNCAVWVVE